MQEAQLLIFKLIAIILIAMVGYFIASRQILGEKGKDIVSLLLNKIALPFMIFAAYTRIKLTPETIVNALYVMIAALVIIGVKYLYNSYKAKKYQLTPKESSVFITGIHANTAFLAFPLLYAVYGDVGLFYATMYYVVDNILLMTSGVGRLMHETKGKRKIPPVTIALFISLIMMAIINIINFDFTTTFIYQAANDLGSMTTALAFIFIGMMIYETNIKELVINKPALNMIVFNTTIIPLLFVVLFKLLNLDIESIIIIVVLTQALMPPFSALLSMSYEYKQDVKMATSLVVVGHIYAIINIPLIFSLLVFLFS